MANLKKLPGNVGGVPGLAVGAAAYVIEQATPVVANIIKDHISSDKPVVPDDSILMPDICSKKIPLNLSQAKELLENCGLKVLPVEIPLADVKIQYKGCFEYQVVGSNKKVGNKLKPGETVIIQYVTAEHIAKSQRLFSEAEQRKAEAKQQRAIKRAETMEQVKTTGGDVAAKAKEGVKKIVLRNGKKAKSKDVSLEKQELSE